MSYIPHNKFNEIKEASKNGNETAKEILEGIKKQLGQDDLNNLVNTYDNGKKATELNDTIRTLIEKYGKEAVFAELSKFE